MLLSDRRRGQSVRRGVAGTVASLLLVGCSGDDFSDLQAYVTEVKSRSKGAIEPLPVVKQVEPFVFPADARRDPFARADKSEQVAAPEPASDIRPDMARPKEELESYELDTLRMVGTVKHQAALWGLVKAADGTIHRVRAGNHMGRNYGRVVQVQRERIELIELISDGPGSWQERPAALDLAEADANDAGGNAK